MSRNAKGAPSRQGRPKSDGADCRSARREIYSPGPALARLILRTITNDDGHFCGLEVSHG